MHTGAVLSGANESRVTSTLIRSDAVGTVGVSITRSWRLLTFIYVCKQQQQQHLEGTSWLRGSAVKRRSLTGELSLVCTGPAADG